MKTYTLELTVAEVTLLGMLAYLGTGQVLLANGRREMPQAAFEDISAISEIMEHEMENKGTTRGLTKKLSEVRDRIAIDREVGGETFEEDKPLA